MKKGKRFDNVLNECLERLLKGETIEQCLQSYPEQAAELEPLLRTALAAKRVSAIQPRAMVYLLLKSRCLPTFLPKPHEAYNGHE